MSMIFAYGSSWSMYYVRDGLIADDDANTSELNEELSSNFIVIVTLNAIDNTKLSLLVKKLHKNIAK